MKVIYIGAFLDEESKARLLAAVPAQHPNVFAEHITLAFKPGLDSPLFLKLGETVEYGVLGYAQDARGQAVVISGPAGMLGQNEFPPITISCADGTKPFYSNELLSNNALTGIPPGLVLRAVVKAVVSRAGGIAHVVSLDP